MDNFLVKSILACTFQSLLVKNLTEVVIFEAKKLYLLRDTLISTTI